MSLVPLCLNFSQWARFWQARVKLPILSGDALFHSCAHELPGWAAWAASLRDPQAASSEKSPASPPLLSSEVLRSCKMSLWDRQRASGSFQLGDGSCLLQHPCFTASSGGWGGDPQATPPGRVEHVPILSQFPAPAVSTELAASLPRC